MQESTSNNQLPRTPSYSHAPERRKPRSTTSKIRDSCHSCAVSKVRCPKEKPTCERCKKRGIVCEYFVTKRPGRKRENRCGIETRDTCNPIGTNTSLIRDEPDTGLSTSEQSSLAILHLNSSSAESRNLSGAVEFSSYIDVLADFMTPLEQSPSPRLSGISNDFNGNITPPMDFLELGSLDSHLSHFAHEPYDIEGLLTSPNIDSGPSFGTPSIGSTLPPKSFFPNPEGQQVLHTNRGENFSRGISEPGGSTCCCIVQALDIMSKLFIPDTPFSASISTSPSDAATISNNTTSDNIGHFSAQSLVTQNRRFIEAVDSILLCSLCVETSYLVTILSTIISKILERYTEAARQCPGHLIFEEYEGTLSNRRRNTTTKEYMAHLGTHSDSHDDDTGRTTARLILGELHRVQGLMNRLSLRQNAPRGDMGPKDITFERNSPVLSSSDGQRTAPGVAFSATTLGEMKTDLRQNLTTLSFGIIKMLRES